ncbi:MAG: DNA-3-methyladenine glycosylase I [Chitinivibrionales bacterium]|nr:DNA-3-methyladenine glycosylase I [Chitinivibrionales bacterium]
MRDVMRCAWADSDPVYRAYHDNEWGIPVHDDKKLFEMLVLECFQAGLSWITILRKRPFFTKAFCGWDFRKVAAFSAADMRRLLADTNIIRNRLKIYAAVANAAAFIAVRKEFGSFDRYLWQFTGGKTLRPQHAYKTVNDIPTHSPASDSLSADLKKRGFSFVGPVVCYAFMQAVGMVDDHLANCYKYIASKNPR